MVVSKLWNMLNKVRLKELTDEALENCKKTNIKD